MKKIIIVFICFIFISQCFLSVFAFTDSNIPATANSHELRTPYSWYCKRTDDHSQPSLDHLLSFTARPSLFAFYADTSHSDFQAKDKVIYLTFDAGYENGNIEKILDILKEEEVPAAFFVLEHLVTNKKELVHRMADEGHLVCNHTATHPDMSKKAGREEFMAELLRLEEVCREQGITLSDYYRPPEGRFTEENLKIAAEEGYATVFWSFAYADWDNGAQLSPSAAKEHILSHTHNGEVILLHPTSATNAAILSELIEEWRAMGFRFGTLDELVKCSSHPE